MLTPLLAALDPHPLSVAPFAILLLCIAVLPLIASHWWHENRHKLIVSVVLGVPVVVYLACLGNEGVTSLLHTGEEYIAFIALLGSLYTVAGGVVLRGELRASPLRNTGLLAFGAVLANIVGTTGASMLLIRPYLNMNRGRMYHKHLAVFFIFIVSNLGGLLTPLGDPPLFLGYLQGVPFFWTLRLWKEWAVTNAIVLTIFLVWDIYWFRHETIQPPPSTEPETRGPLRLGGWINVLLLAGVVGSVLLPAPELVKAAVMIALSLLSLRLTPRGIRAEQAFTWGPIIEVAVIFLGLFATMVPALALLKSLGAEAAKGGAVMLPWRFFWLTGLLSSCLDNAPTYLAFGTLAAASGDGTFRWLAEHNPAILEAISCGAVFMGANTYIGNGPNFMVKAIADEQGIPAPSFFGYMLYSTAVLMPPFVLVTWLFFL